SVCSRATVNSAQVTYARTCGGDGYAQDLQDLATPPTSGGDAFIGLDLSVNGALKSGYIVALAAGANSIAVRTSANSCNGTNSFSTYHATATPAAVGQSGTRAFATNNSGAIFQNFTGAAIPVTMAGTQLLQYRRRGVHYVQSVHWVQ